MIFSAWLGITRSVPASRRALPCLQILEARICPVVREFVDTDGIRTRVKSPQVFIAIVLLIAEIALLLTVVTIGHQYAYEPIAHAFLR